MNFGASVLNLKWLQGKSIHDIRLPIMAGPTNDGNYHYSEMTVRFFCFVGNCGKLIATKINERAT
jgi:hypothetical protein